MTLPLLAAFDPGTQRCAAVALTPGTRGRLHVVHHEMIDSTPLDIAEFLVALEPLGRVDCAAIEWVDGSVFEQFRAKPLLASQGVAGEISGIAFSMGFHVEKVIAQRWRDAFVGRAPKGFAIPGVKTPKNATDVRVARAIPLLVSGTEAFGPTSHQYDACGVGLMAARKVWGPGNRLANSPRAQVR